jgi:hypothetical protein
VKRQVFERLARPWWLIHAGKHGSDMYFTTKAVEAGFEVWVEPRIQCGQVEYVSWGLQHYRQRLLDDPEFLKRGGIIGSAEAAYGA